MFAFDEGDDERGGKLLQTAREMMTLDSPWIDMAFDLACAIHYNLQNKSNITTKYTKKTLHTTKTLKTITLHSTTYIILLKTLISLYTLNTIKTYMAYYKKVVFPVRLTTIFKHTIKQIINKLHKLPASFSAMVMPALQADRPDYDDIATDSDGLLSC